MNALLWIAQILLAGIFLFTGMTKLFAYEKLTRRLESLPGRGAVTVTRAQAVPVGLLEIAGAIGVVMPPMFTEALAPDYLLVRLAAAGLMLLMVGAGIYHAKRRESAAPSITLFLLALFILVGRWPHWNGDGGADHPVITGLHERTSIAS